MSLAEKIREDGTEVKVYDLARCDMSAAVADAFRYSRLVLATTTYNGDVFPFMREFINHLVERNFRGRKVGIIENGTWAPTAAKTIRGMLEGCRDIIYTDTTVKILSALSSESIAQLNLLKEEIQK